MVSADKLQRWIRRGDSSERNVTDNSRVMAPAVISRIYETVFPFTVRLSLLKPSSRISKKCNAPLRRSEFSSVRLSTARDSPSGLRIGESESSWDHVCTLTLHDPPPRFSFHQRVFSKCSFPSSCSFRIAPLMAVLYGESEVSRSFWAAPNVPTSRLLSRARYFPSSSESVIVCCYRSHIASKTSRSRPCDFQRSRSTPVLPPSPFPFSSLEFATQGLRHDKRTRFRILRSFARRSGRKSQTTVTTAPLNRMEFWFVFAFRTNGICLFQNDGGILFIFFFLALFAAEGDIIRTVRKPHRSTA